MARGRPKIEFKDEYCDQVYRLCLLGHTDKQLAKFFDISERTLNKWKKEYPEFMQSIKEGKDIADAEIVESLYNRAKGITLKKDVQVGNGKITLENQLPPDPTSMIFWLKNRQPEKWRDKQEHKVEHEGGVKLEIFKIGDTEIEF